MMVAFFTLEFFSKTIPDERYVFKETSGIYDGALWTFTAHEKCLWFCGVTVIVMCCNYKNCYVIEICNIFRPTMGWVEIEMVSW